MKLLLSVFIFLSFYSLSADSTAVVKDSVPSHSFKKAVIFSAIVPGAGQIYNHITAPKGKKKAFWKVPLIYAGIGASTYYFSRNQQQQKLYRKEYENRQNDSNYIPGSAFPEEPNLPFYDDQSVLTLYDQYLRRRDRSVLAVVAVYVLQIVDAGVEAHFINFDISEDLSLTVAPMLFDNYSTGFNFRLNFR